MTNGVKGLSCVARPVPVVVGEFEPAAVVVVEDLMVWLFMVLLGSASTVVSMYALPIGSPWQTCTDSILNGGLYANALGIVVPMARSTDSL